MQWAFFMLKIFLNRARIILVNSLCHFILLLSGIKSGKQLRITGRMNLYVHPTAKIKLGHKVRINSGFSENPVGGASRMGIWVGPNAQLTIGNNVGMSNSTLVCMQRVTIGDDVFIGGDCKIYDTDFHAVPAAARLQNAPPRTAPVHIGSKTFIGGHSIILKGVSIGEGAVIGAGSVITKDIPPYQIWAGNPAKYVADVTDS